MTREAKITKKRRDDTIKRQIKQVLGMSVPKYIAIMYGKSQKAAQIMFNQVDRRTERDDALLDEIYLACQNPDVLSAQFIGHVLGSDQTVLSHIQTTIDLRFQSLEAQNTVKSLSRPMLSDQPAIRQIEMINDRYFYQAIDMQNTWLEAKNKQRELKGKGTVHIPYTLEQIKNAFQVVIDMCLLVIDLKAGEDTMSGREALARAYALASAAAIQIGRYDLIEEFAARWRERFELHTDPDIPLRVRNLLFQKELWIFKRKGDYAGGLAVAETQWAAGAQEKVRPRWVDIEPLVCAGLELASLQLKKCKDDGDSEAANRAREQVAVWLDRFDKSPERAAELGQYLQQDMELEPVREERAHPVFQERWGRLMKKFGMLSLLFLGLLVGIMLFLSAAPQSVDLAANAANLQPADALSSIDVAGANPGKLIQNLLDLLFGLVSSTSSAA